MASHNAQQPAPQAMNHQPHSNAPVPQQQNTHHNVSYRPRASSNRHRTVSVDNMSILEAAKRVHLITFGMK